MAKTVFFTVFAPGETRRREIILEFLSRRHGAIELYLTQFDPKKDADEIKGFIALVELKPEKFTGKWDRVGPQAPDLPPFAQLAKDRVLIGPKAVISVENAEKCARQIFLHFPPNYIPPELRNDLLNRRSRIHEGG